MRIIVGVSGASGSVYGFRLLKKLRQREDVEIHLILTRLGERTAYLENGRKAADFKQLAHQSYPFEDLSCPLASGSFPIDSMVIAPCSVHSMSAIAHGITSNALTRAADVTLKERRKLILLVRETPLHIGHLRTMVKLAEMGAVIVPPVPGFYHQPKTIEDIVDHTVERVMDLLGIPAPDAQRWEGPE